jgi:hypothetical protein
VSVHLIDEGIDTGPVLLRRMIEAFDPATLEHDIRRAQAAAFAEVLRAIRGGGARPADTFLEPSRLERGVPARIAREVMQRVSTSPGRLRSFGEADQDDGSGRHLRHGTP